MLEQTTLFRLRKEQNYNETQGERDARQNEVLQVAEDGAAEARAHLIDARRLLLNGMEIAILELCRRIQCLIALSDCLLNRFYTLTTRSKHDFRLLECDSFCR